MAACILTGCFSDKASKDEVVAKAQEVSEESNKSEIIKDETTEQKSEKSKETSDTRITDKTPRITKVGSEINGYIELTQGEWVEFREEGGLSDEGVVAADQATTVTNSAIITMVTYDVDMDIDDMAKNGMAYCESTGAKDVEGARVNIGEYDCDQVYCYYPDYGRYLVTWYFKADDGFVHYIAAEFSPNDTYVADLVESYHLDNIDSLQGKEEDSM